MKKYSFLAIALILALVCSCSLEFRVNVKESKISSPTSTANLKVESSKSFTDIEIKTALLDEKGNPAKTTSGVFSASALDENNELAYDFKSFGKHEVTINLKKDGKTVDTLLQDIVITSDTYNIAVLVATMPNSILTPAFLDADNNSIIDSTIPTVILLQRAASLDWNNLPANMVACPFASKAQITTSTTSADGNNYHFHQINEMNSYIAYLLTLNPDSVFNIYLNDYHFYDFFYLLEGTGVKASNLGKIYALSDGTASYSSTREAYGAVENPEKPSMAAYAEYQKKWNASKEALFNGGKFAIERGEATTAYIPVAIEDTELDITWLINRKNADTLGTSDVFTNIINPSAKVVTYNLNTLLTNLSETEKDSLRDVMHLDLDQFNAADEAGKTPMLFLGTRNDQDKQLAGYLEFMEAFYGDTYAYFYKGHPGDPTEFNVGRQNILKNFDTENLDCSVAAEFFLFFRPDALPVGYSSSTFLYKGSSYEIPLLVDTIASTSNGCNVKVAIKWNGDNSNYDVYNYETGKKTTWTSGTAISTLSWSDI